MNLDTEGYWENAQKSKPQQRSNPELGSLLAESFIRVADSLSKKSDSIESETNPHIMAACIAQRGMASALYEEATLLTRS